MRQITKLAKSHHIITHAFTTQPLTMSAAGRGPRRTAEYLLGIKEMQITLVRARVTAPTFQLSIHPLANTRTDTGQHKAWSASPLAHTPLLILVLASLRAPGPASWLLAIGIFASLCSSILAAHQLNTDLPVLRCAHTASTSTSASH
jgi:hypothetical protein